MLSITAINSSLWHSCYKVLLSSSSGLTCKKTQSHVGFLCTSTYDTNFSHARLSMSILFLLLPVHYLGHLCLVWYMKHSQINSTWKRFLADSYWWPLFHSFVGVQHLFPLVPPTLNSTHIPFLRVRIQPKPSQSPCSMLKALKCFSRLMILNFSLTKISASSKNGQTHCSILKWLVTSISPKAEHSN